MSVTTEPTSGAPEKNDLVWAQEVLKVYRNLGARGTVRRLGSRSARALHEWASNPENMEKFLSGMVPKATDILAKHQKPEDSPELQVAERKALGELKQLLAEALTKSQLVSPL